MFSYFNKCKYSLGLDIGEDYFSWIELCKHHNSIKLISHGYYAVSKKQVHENQNNNELLGKMLKKNITQKKLKIKRAYLAVSSLKVIKKKLVFDADLSDQAIEKQFMIDQNKTGHFAHNKDLHWYSTLVTNKTLNPNTQEVSVCATYEKEIIMQI